MKKLLKSLFCLTLFFSLVLVVSSCKKTEPVETTPESNPVTDGPSNVTTDVDLLDLFQDDGSGVYTATKEDGKLNVAVNKGVTEGTEWASLKADLSGKDLSKIQSLRFNIGGTCQVKLKIQSTAGGKEVDLALSTALAYEWDLSGADEQAILAESDVLVLVFAIPGKAQGEGSFTLTNVVLSEEEAMFNPIQSGHTNISNDVNNYDGTSATFDFNSLWTENDGGTYTFSDAADGVEVEFNVTGWQFAYSPIAGAFGKFDYVTFKVTGTVGQSVLFKVEKSPVIKEAKVEFNGSEQVISIDLTSFNDADIAALPRVLFFANSGQKGAGTFTIHEAYFGTEDETDLGGAPELGEDERVLVYDGIANGFDLNKNWYSGDKDVYTVTNMASPWVIEWNKAEGQAWAALKLDIKGNFGNFEKVSLGVELPEGMKFIAKVEGNGAAAEVKGEGLGTNKATALEIDLTGLTVAQRDGLTNVLLFIDYENGAANTGSVKIHWFGMSGFKYRGVGQVVYDGTSTADLGLANEYLHDTDGVYTIQKASEVEGANGTYYVSYDKGTYSYAALKVYVAGKNIGDYTVLKAGLMLPEGKTAILKVQGTNCTKEVKIEGTGSYKLYELDLTDKTPVERDTISMVLIMVEGGATEVTGAFEIHHMQLSGYVSRAVPPYVYNGTDNSFNINAENRWVGSKEGAFAVTSFKNNDQSPWVITYTNKGAWDHPFVKFEGITEELNKVSIGIEAPEGMKMIVKIEGTKGAKEVKIEGTGKCAAFTLDFSDLTAEQKQNLNALRIFIDYENGEAHSGSITVHWAGINKQ